MKSTKSRTAHQPTLVGLWQREDDKGGDCVDAVTSREKKRSPSSLLQSDQSAPPPLRKIHRSNSPRWEDLSLPNGPMFLLRGCIGGKNSHERRLVREALKSLPDWNDNVKFKIFGKECQMRRRICQYSKGGKVSYSYSGLRFDAPEFPEVLHDIKCKVEKMIRDYILDISKDETSSQKHRPVPPEFIAGEEIFNYCLCNHYRTGEDSMGYHADDEAALDHTAPIASLSFGVTRSFDIRPKRKTSDGKKSRLARISLGDGDLLVMLFPMQHNYEHAIPIEKRVSGERINLTFRRIRA